MTVGDLIAALAYFPRELRVMFVWRPADYEFDDGDELYCEVMVSGRQEESVVLEHEPEQVSDNA